MFYRWCVADGRGLGFSSSTGFRLPNGAVRSPDLAWVERSQWEGLSQEDREKFPPICPPFVVEIRSTTDSLEDLQDKMDEYLANGTQLGWLVDPAQRRVYVYRPDAEVVCLREPATISGDPLLAGFHLELEKIWS
jgi:Uma2 family endonuclease